MKMQKSVIFLKINLNIKISETKNIVNLEITVIIQEKIAGAVYSICNSKQSVPKKFLWFFKMNKTMNIILHMNNLFWHDYLKPKYGEKPNCVIWNTHTLFDCIHKSG